MENANLTNFSRPIFVIGSQGQVGTSLAKAIHDLAPEFAEKSFFSVAFQNSPDFPQQVRDQIGSHQACDLILATGLTNPALSPAALDAANYLQVQELVTLCNHPQRRFVTLGSIFEIFPEVCAQNPYLQSKLKLSQWVQAQSQNLNLRHLRLHTLYGGDRTHLKEHMFLGQIAKSLTSGSDFKMSSGEQLREYHHVDDIARGILSGLTTLWQGSQICEINSGKPLKLKDIATELFKTYGRLESLHLGAISSAQGENMTKVFQSNSDYARFQFREALHGIKDWFHQIL